MPSGLVISQKSFTFSGTKYSAQHSLSIRSTQRISYSLPKSYCNMSRESLDQWEKSKSSTGDSLNCVVLVSLEMSSQICSRTWRPIRLSLIKLHLGLIIRLISSARNFPRSLLGKELKKLLTLSTVRRILSGRSKNLKRNKVKRRKRLLQGKDNLVDRVLKDNLIMISKVTLLTLRQNLSEHQPSDWARYWRIVCYWTWI